jgi:hypothetical protein
MTVATSPHSRSIDKAAYRSQLCEPRVLPSRVPARARVILWGRASSALIEVWGSDYASISTQTKRDEIGFELGSFLAFPTLLAYTQVIAEFLACHEGIIVGLQYRGVTTPI